MNTVTANILVLLGWGVTIALVYSLLSGPFDGRMCESTCFSMLYWGALVLAIFGTLLSLIQAFKANSGIFSKLGVLLGFFLCAKLIGVMVIGTMSG
ncbi:MAG: hypothetical protein R8G33_09290 [Gammaproteobacteria bacterium]|nr:hypothetical protein [Gammaproteobacteria bacterium]